MTIAFQKLGHEAQEARGLTERFFLLAFRMAGNFPSVPRFSKNGKLRGKDFFNVKEDPYITFTSTKITQTGPLTFELDGDFTIRGVTKKEKLKLTDSGKGSPTGFIIGTMPFDRKEYDMNSGIPFIKIANRVEVNVNLKWTRISGLPPVFDQ